MITKIIGDYEITVEPEKNADGTTTGDYNFMIDHLPTLKLIDSGSGYRTPEFAEEAAIERLKILIMAS
jgi:hypothetical protein